MFFRRSLISLKTIQWVSDTLLAHNYSSTCGVFTEICFPPTLLFWLIQLRRKTPKLQSRNVSFKSRSCVRLHPPTMTYITFSNPPSLFNRGCFLSCSPIHQQHQQQLSASVFSLSNKYFHQVGNYCSNVTFWIQICNMMTYISFFNPSSHPCSWMHQEHQHKYRLPCWAFQILISIRQLIAVQILHL